MMTVIVLQGIPGSGKSTFAQKLISDVGGSHVVVSADHYFERIGGGTYKFVPGRLGDAHQDCYRRFLTAAVEDINLIIVDNCSTEAVTIAPYVMLAEALDYKVRIIRVECDPEVAAKRNIHAVPVDTVKKIAAEFEDEKRRYPKWWKFETIKTDESV